MNPLQVSGFSDSTKEELRERFPEQFTKVENPLSDSKEDELLRTLTQEVQEQLAAESIETLDSAGSEELLVPMSEKTLEDLKKTLSGGTQMR